MYRLKSEGYRLEEIVFRLFILLLQRRLIHDATQGPAKYENGVWFVFT